MIFVIIFMSLSWIEIAKAMKQELNEKQYAITDQEIIEAPNAMKFKAARLMLSQFTTQKKELFNHYKQLIMGSYHPAGLYQAFTAHQIIISSWRCYGFEDTAAELSWAAWKGASYQDSYEYKKLGRDVAMREKYQYLCIADQWDASDLFEWFELPKSYDPYLMLKSTLYNSMAVDAFKEVEVKDAIKELSKNFIGCVTTELKKRYGIEVTACAMEYLPLYEIKLQTSNETEQKTMEYIDRTLRGL